MSEPAESAATATSRAGATDAKHILVVDDDPAICNMIREALAEAGYRTDCVADGAAAVAAVTVHRPDLILLDVRMPGVNGWDVLGQLRAQAGPQQPIVIMTGQYEGQDQALASGAQGYLAKPFDLDDLLECVDLHANLHLVVGNHDEEMHTPRN